MRTENSKRIAAAESLIDLAESGNGSDFCEPHSGTGTMTDISMADLCVMEMKQLNLVKQNKELSEVFKAQKGEFKAHY